MNGFLEALMFVLSVSPQYPTPTEHHIESLVIQYAPLEEIRARFGVGMFAVYLNSGFIIRAQDCLIAEEDTSVGKFCKSTLAHELTHWLDHINQGWPQTCEALQAAERRGYVMQKRAEMTWYGYMPSGLRMPLVGCVERGDIGS